MAVVRRQRESTLECKEGGLQKALNGKKEKKIKSINQDLSHTTSFYFFDPLKSSLNWVDADKAPQLLKNH